MGKVFLILFNPCGVMNSLLRKNISKGWEKKLYLVFKNYIPRTKSLKKYIKKTPVETENWQSQFRELKKEATKLEMEYDLTPRNVTWDLKRDIKKDLKILERKTFLIIQDIITGKMETSEE